MGSLEAREKRMSKFAGSSTVEQAVQAKLKISKLEKKGRSPAQQQQQP